MREILRTRGACTVDHLQNRFSGNVAAIKKTRTKVVHKNVS